LIGFVGRRNSRLRYEILDRIIVHDDGGGGTDNGNSEQRENDCFPPVAPRLPLVADRALALSAVLVPGYYSIMD